MGTLTLSQIQAEITSGLGNRADVTPARITNVVNLMQSRLSRFYDFTEMQLVTPTVPYTQTGNPSQDKYMNVPANTKTIHVLKCLDGANSRKLIEKPWRMFNRTFPLPEILARAWPDFYTRFGNQLVLMPIPLIAFQFEMYSVIWPTPLVNPTDISGFDNKDDILVVSSLGYLYRSLGRPDKADTYEQQAAQLALEAKMRDNTRPDMDASPEGFPAGGPITEYWINPFVEGVAA